MKTGLFTLLLLMTFTQCQSPQNKEVQQEKTKPKIEYATYDSKSYSIKYPSSWKAYTISQYSELGSIMDESKGGFKFARNIQVLVTDKSGATLDKMRDKYTKEILTFDKNANILSNERLERDGVPYHQIIYQSSAITKSKNINHYYAKEGMGVFVSFTSTQEEFDDFKSSALEILSTFKLK